MFAHHIQVRLRDTDATGVIYFAEQLRMALETFEEFLKNSGYGLAQLLNSPYLMPVVHAEADYLAPIQVGDELKIVLSSAHVGTKSLSLEFIFYKQDAVVGKAKLVHVLVDKETRQSVPIPDALKEIFERDTALK